MTTDTKTEATQVIKGLANVVVAESRMSTVDGERGVLTIAGYDINDLAEYSNFEEVAYLLWHGRLPTQTEFSAFTQELGRERNLPEPIHKLLLQVPHDAVPMDVLRTAVSALAFYDPDRHNNDQEANRRKSRRLTAQIPTIIAAFHRLRSGKDPIAPQAELDLAGNFIYMLNGREPTEVEERALDTYLVLMIDHGMNASTFSARVTAGTLADMHAAITTAIGTLSGPLHGGANEAAMKMMLEIGDPARVEEYVMDALARKQRIMGIGHRVYKVMDPRAKILKRMCEELSQDQGDDRWLRIANKVAEVMEREKGLYPNVDFYSAPVMYMLGIKPDLYTPMFAMSRVAGWTGHVLEQYADNRLIRPRGQYVGPRDLKYKPIDQR